MRGSYGFFFSIRLAYPFFTLSIGIYGGNDILEHGEMSLDMLQRDDRDVVWNNKRREKKKRDFEFI